MPLRTALPQDIPALHRIRMAVKENMLNNPALVTEADYTKFLTTHGKGWLHEANGVITGFAIIDTEQYNIWALFVDPAHEKKGIGRQLHNVMLDWHFAQSDRALWLSTAPGTRAADFYRKAGWTETGVTKSGELKFEITRDDWRASRVRS